MFTYEFSCAEKKSRISVEVPIPLRQSVEDFLGRLVVAHNIPCFAVSELKRQLQSYVLEEERCFFVNKAAKVIQLFRDGSVNVDELSNKWEQVFAENVRAFTPQDDGIDLSFADIYKRLIHSPSLNIMLNIEHAYSLAVQDLVRERDYRQGELQKRQAEEMTQALTGENASGRPYTDEQINNLAQKHFEQIEFESTRWESEVMKLRENQKLEYHKWLENIHDDPEQSATRARALSHSMSVSHGDDDGGGDVPPPRLEESFTIHLGAQLKTTHNLRILSANVLDLCRHTTHMTGDKVIPAPQRLQTALSLYSNKLCGLMLLVDDRLNSYTGLKKELQQQLDCIESEVIQSNELRQTMSQSNNADRTSVKSSSSAASLDSQEKKAKMQCGSFYVTKHSNLAEVHTVFHLVTDETLLSDITSRHPVILGLRNVLKACFRFDVTTLTIPLLLTHEMTEEMTIPWCMKRAELVFKCVKGFMMEMSTWAGSESRTVQFLVPTTLSDDTFSMLSNMLPGIFRQSNPIVGN